MSSVSEIINWSSANNSVLKINSEVSYHQIYSPKDWLSILRTPYPSSRKGDSHLIHNSLTSPRHAPYLLHPLHSLFLYSEPPLTCHPPSYWLRLFLSQTELFSNPVILHTYLPMKMGHSVSKRQRIKFRHHEITPRRKHTTFRTRREFEIKKTKEEIIAHLTQITENYCRKQFRTTQLLVNKYKPNTHKIGQTKEYTKSYV